ncbi:MAG: 30S ribosomal protein S3 [Candidatus Dependentiae bacterium]|nr:30S ribosomal protein S3 [Candidatus Dependentiae bacterium]
MGQKVHPIGFRLGVYRDWDARWFARNSYGKQALEDLEIRRFLDTSLEKAEISRIEIEKAGDNVRIVVHSARPGAVIGKRGQEIDFLRNQLIAKIKKSNVEISVQEIKTPELDAIIVAKNIADQLEKRGSYKKAMKKAALSAMKAGAKGIKICCAGRLNGAEIARTEWTRVGSVPLHTLRADIDYGLAEAYTTYGKIGIKVWICRGEYQQI